MSLFTRARRWQLGTMLYALVLVGQLPGAGLTSGATAGTTGHSSSGPLRLQPVRPSRHLGHGLSRTRFGALPLRFERMADAPDAGLFAARGPGYSLMIGPAQMTLALLSASGGHTHLPLSAVQNKVTRGLSPHHIPALAIDIEAATVPHVGPASVHLLRWRFLGANATHRPALCQGCRGILPIWLAGTGVLGERRCPAMLAFATAISILVLTSSITGTPDRSSTISWQVPAPGSALYASPLPAHARST